MTEKIRIKVGDLPLVELFQIKKATGRSMLAEMRENGTKALDEEMVAALIWVVRKREQPELTFEEVFAMDLGEMLETVVLDLSGKTPPLPAAASTTRKRSRQSSGSTPPGPPAP